MTVSIGFSVGEGIVLCSDRQHTSSTGFKFEKKKLLRCEHIGGAAMIFSYAGEREPAEILFGKVHNRLMNDLDPSEPADHRDPPEVIRDVLEEIFQSSHSENLETLIGIRKGWFPCLFRTSANRVVRGQTEWIGCGDSSVIRFLSDLIPQSHCTHIDAAILGSYLIAAANRYIDGCGGGPDAMFLPNQYRSEYSKFPAMSIVDHFEKAIANQIGCFRDIEHKIGGILRENLLGVESKEG
jgi:hypothetical protein